MTDPVLLDTNIVIDFLRARPEAVSFIMGLLSQPRISVLTVAELYQGVRDRPERVQLGAFLSKADVVPLDEPTATVGGLFARTFRKRHGVGLADALIAALARELGLTLVTLNQKHFPMLTDVLVPY